MARGAIWMMLQRVAIRVIGLASTVVLARVLIPGDFGLVALATGFQAVIESVAELGFDLALVQRQTSDRAAYDTAWTLNVIRGLLIAAILLGTADPVASFYGDDRLAAILRWLALGPFVAGVANIGTVEFHRDLRFDVEFRLAVWSKIAAVLVTVPWALWRHDYWALVGGILAGKVVASALSYVVHPYRPRFSLADIRGFLHFSSWLSINNLIGAIKARLDALVVGKLLGASALGIYSVAFEISNLITSELMWPIARVVFSGFARLADKPAELARGYTDLLATLILVAVPMAVGIGLTAEFIVQIFLGGQWEGAIPLIRILAIFGVLNFATANSQAIFLALGRADLVALANLPAFILLPPLLIWASAEYGLVGAAWAMLADGAVNLVANLAIMRRQVAVSLLELLAAVWRPLLATLGMVAGVVPLMAAWPKAATALALIPQFVCIAGIGAAIYVSIVLALWRIAGAPNGPERQLLSALGLKRASDL